MLNKEFLLRRLNSMSSDELALLIRQSLSQSDIPYQSGSGRILYDSLFSEDYECISSFSVTQNASISVPEFVAYRKELCSDIVISSVEIRGTSLSGFSGTDVAVAA